MDEITSVKSHVNVKVVIITFIHMPSQDKTYVNVSIIDVSITYITVSIIYMYVYIYRFQNGYTLL